MQRSLLLPTLITQLTSSSVPTIFPYPLNTSSLIASSSPPTVATWKPPVEKETVTPPAAAWEPVVERYRQGDRTLFPLLCTQAKPLVEKISHEQYFAKALGKEEAYCIAAMSMVTFWNRASLAGDLRNIPGQLYHVMKCDLLNQIDLQKTRSRREVHYDANSETVSEGGEWPEPPADSRDEPEQQVLQGYDSYSLAYTPWLEEGTDYYSCNDNAAVADYNYNAASTEALTAHTAATWDDVNENTTTCLLDPAEMFKGVTGLSDQARLGLMNAAAKLGLTQGQVA